MAKPKCLTHQEHESLIRDADQELTDVYRIWKDGHPDDSSSNRNNFNSYLETLGIRMRELVEHEAACEECQRAD